MVISSLTIRVSISVSNIIRSSVLYHSFARIFDGNLPIVKDARSTAEEALFIFQAPYTRRRKTLGPITIRLKFHYYLHNIPVVSRR